MTPIIRRLLELGPVSLLLLACFVHPTRAQIPDEFTNLQVLPSDIEKRELVGIMRGYASALGARCNFCHVGEDPNSLDGYDFASDDNEHKVVARAMMKMVQSINDGLLPETGLTDPREVRCVTCHRGVHEPETLDRLLLETIEENGVSAAVAKYRELRDEYHGKGSYNFGPGTLNHVAETHARTHEDLDGAISLMLLNVEFHPDAAYSHLMLGQLHAMKGNTEASVASIERALELEPDNRRAKQLLERVQSPE